MDWQGRGCPARLVIARVRIDNQISQDAPLAIIGEDASAKMLKGVVWLIIVREMDY